MSVPTSDICLVVVRETGGGRPRVLLGEKLRGFGLGRIVAPGGKIDAGEPPAEAAARELREETGLEVQPQQLHPAGRLDFTFSHDTVTSLRAHVFTAASVGGTATDSDEIAVHWIPESEIPYARMWDDARYWLPRVLDGRDANLDFTYGPGNAVVEKVHDREGTG